MLYFAYGSNMSIPRLSRRISGLSKMGIATLNGHSLEFHKSGSDGSAKCDIAVSGDEDSLVMGVVFEFPDSQLKKLNLVEGHGKGYDSKYASVSLGDKTDLEAYTYIATSINRSLKPFHWYKHHVVFGARESGLPHWYIDQLLAVESIDDPDPGRSSRQMSMYLQSNE